MFNKIKNTTLVLLFLVTLIFGYLLFKKKDSEIVIKKVLIEVEVPKLIGSFPAIVMPEPKKTRPRPKLIEEFTKATSSEKDSLYADAVTERTYEEIFKDSIQSINVETIVQGKLLKQTLNYEIFPRTVIVEKNIPIEIPTRIKIFAGMELDYPLNLSREQAYKGPALKFNLFAKTKRDLLLHVGYDTRSNVYVGAAVKIKIKKPY
jgi:hypothetical protein